METTNAPETTRDETTLIGTSIVIKGELSCGADLYIDGQVEGTIDPKGNRLTIGPHGRVKANVNASAVVVQGKPRRQYSSERSGGPKAVGRCHGRHRDPSHLH